MKKTNKILAAAIASLVMSPITFATNGMNMEGYGPVSTAMGGTAQAYNNGLGGMMNNPATMGWQCENADCKKFSVGVGVLQPTVSASMNGMPTADSSGNQYWMPGIGYAQKKNGVMWGVGVLAQGGMGTDYSATSMLAMGTAKPVRSELSVGRLVIPFGMEINKDLQVAASLDYIWAGLDLRMAVPGSQFGQMASDNNTLMAIGGMSQQFGMMAGVTNPNNVMGRFDFSNGDSYSGEAKSTGRGGKLGLVYKLNKDLTVGASYHFKTRLGDLSTSNATLTFQDVSQPNNRMATMPVIGQLRVVDFQWPETYGVGVAYQATNDLMVAVDVKKIAWSGVMKSFNMSFDSAMTGTLNFNMPQNWDDQTVFMLGGAYKLNPSFTLRAGLNKANNPVPDTTLNYLFPAIVQDHYSLGFGYTFNKTHQIDASAVVAPEVSQTSLSTGMTSKHSQTNLQLMYTYSF